jgi:hypothetical protein
MIRFIKFKNLNSEMNLRQLTKQKLYVITMIVAVIMVLLGTYLFIDACKENDRIFIRGILLIIWTVLAIIYFGLYRKEIRSSSN